MIIETIRSPHQTIQIAERRGVRFMRFGAELAGWQGAMLVRQPSRLYFPYQQAVALHTMLRPAVSRFLAVGVGTGTAVSHVHRRHPQARITGIDVDAAVTAAAIQHFKMPADERTQFIEADARSYVPRMEEQFDLILLDVFYREEIPQTFLSPVYLRSLAERLMTGGVLVMNVILPATGPHSRKLLELGHYLNILVGPAWYMPLGVMPFSAQNIVLFAQRDPVATAPVSLLRRRGAREIGAHRQTFARYAPLLPWRLKSFRRNPDN